VAPVQSAVTKGSLDLLAEANLQLNFGRSVKAEELLKKAIHLDPTNIAIKTALLEIYADRKDSASFNSLAIEIKDSNDDDAWLKVASLGRELDPKNQLYVATQNSESVASSPQILAAESAAIVETVADKKAGSPVANDINLKEISLHLDDSATGHSAATATDNKEAIWHEVATKIDLAKAYQAMGEVAGMREILKEVMREGDDGQRQIAQKMLQSLG
jgi:pilus assembly protein FimV